MRDNMLTKLNNKLAIERRAVRLFAQEIEDKVASYLYKTNFDGHKLR